MIDGTNQEAFDLLIERGHRRYQSGLAGRCKRHRYFNGMVFTSLTGRTRGLALVWDRLRGLLRLRRRLRYLLWLACGRPLDNPANVMPATGAIGGGFWGVGGVASDGANLSWLPVTPLNWQRLDGRRSDHPVPTRSGVEQSDHRLLGANQLDSSIVSTPIWVVRRPVIDVPGATPSQLVVALAKIGMLTWLIEPILAVHVQLGTGSCLRRYQRRPLRTTRPREPILLLITTGNTSASLGLARRAPLRS